MNKLWKRLQEEGIKITYNDMKNILQNQEAYQINNRVKKPKFSNIVADSPLFQHTDRYLYLRQVPNPLIQIHYWAHLFQIRSVSSAHEYVNVNYNVQSERNVGRNIRENRVEKYRVSSYSKLDI